MNQKLAVNQLPLPKYFNGYQWDTQFLPNRKSIPKYLHSDLPKLKYQLLREQFKQISQFQCPRLEYFQKIIKSHNSPKRPVRDDMDKKKLKKQKQQIIEQWQYTILTNDKDSNVIDHMLQKSQQFDKKTENKFNEKMQQALLLKKKRKQLKKQEKKINLPTIASTNFEHSIMKQVKSQTLTRMNSPSLIEETTEEDIPRSGQRMNRIKQSQSRLNQSLQSSYKLHSKQNGRFHNSSKIQQKRTYSLPKKKGEKYFNDTIDLIFKYQKHMILNRPEEDPENNLPEKYLAMINNIKLKEISLLDN